MKKTRKEHLKLPSLPYHSNHFHHFLVDSKSPNIKHKPNRLIVSSMQPIHDPFFYLENGKAKIKPSLPPGSGRPKILNKKKLTVKSHRILPKP